MSMQEPPSKQGNTYILDPESPEELGRQSQMDRLITNGMGGSLAGLPTLPPNAKVLDIACGAGGWVLDAAFERRDIEFAGIDVSRIMIDYANARATSEGRTNATFGVMDVRQPLDFSDHTFDLVNARWLTSFLFQQDWLNLLRECVRITRPGGVIRLTESDTWGLTTSEGFEKVIGSVYQAMKLGGYGFSPDGHSLGITPKLPVLLRQVGCQNLQIQAHAVEFSAGTPAWADAYHNILISLQEGTPFPVLMGIATQEEIDAWRAQMEIEMHQDDFGGFCYLTSVWATTPV